MKNGKLAALLNTPARLVIAVGLLILLGEFLVMVLFEGAYNALPKDTFLKGVAFEFIDPLLLAILVSPALFLLFFKPMNEQQAELKNAHKKISQAFQEWAAALDAVDDPIFLHDQDFRILRCNKAYQQCAGIPFKQIIGQPYYAVFPKAAGPLPCCLHAMEKAEEDEEEILVGEAVYRSRAFSIHDEQGVYLYSVHTLEDITENQQAVTQLKLFRNLLDQSSDGFAIVDPDTSRFLDVNETICRDLRYPRDELLQRGVLDIQTSIRDVATWQMHQQELRSQGHALVEFESLRKDGSRIPVEVSLRYVTDKNQDYIIAVVRDITERKKAEETLRISALKHQLLFESSRDALLLAAPPSWKFTGANQATLQLFGASSVAELTALGPRDVSPQRQPDGRPSSEKAQEVIATAMREGSHFFDWKFQRLDGQLFDADVLLTRMEMDEDVFLQGTIRDITERKRVEQELRKRRLNRNYHQCLPVIKFHANFSLLRFYFSLFRCRFSLFRYFLEGFPPRFAHYGHSFPLTIYKLLRANSTFNCASFFLSPL